MPFKEQTRIVLPTLAVSLLLLILAGIAAWFLHRSQREASQLLTQNISRLQAAEELMLIGEQLQNQVEQFLFTTDRKSLKPFASLKKEALSWLQRAEELITSNENRALVEQLRKGHEQYLAQLENLIDEAPSPEKHQKIISSLNGIYKEKILQPARKYQQFNRRQLASMTTQSEHLSNRMGVTLVLLGISGAWAGLFAGLAVARGVQQRLLDNQRSIAHSEQLATLGRVAAALAHELRNPLTSMRLIAQSAATHEGRVSLDAKEFLILEQEIERLDSSIQTFLDYARPPRPEKRTCIVQSLVRQTVDLVQRRAAQIGVTIRNEMPLEPIEVDADPGQIKQVLLNILINALDASPHGGTITLQCSSSDMHVGHRTQSKLSQIGEYVEIDIIDTGSGLPPDLSSHIFDAFVSTKETGTGLGLAICKRIIEDHGGELEAQDAQDAGAIFTVRLPRVQQDTIRQVSAARPTQDH